MTENNKLNFLKSFFKRPFIKYFALFLLGIVIAISISLEILHFKNKTIEPHPSPKEPLQNQTSESLKQLNPSLTSEGPIKLVYDLPEKQPVVYITIDDGWYPNDEVLKLMQQYHLPITTFLIEQAAQEHPAFWHQFVNDGGHIEDHTFNHPFLTHLSQTEDKSQISQPIDYFRQYGPPPDELRPPYGDYNPQVGQAAWDSGIKYVVMWDAEMEKSALSTRSGSEIKPGDIILLHWVPGLDQEIVKLLNIIQKQNLGIADLTQALNGEPLTICWLKAPIPESMQVSPLKARNDGATRASEATVTSGSASSSAVKGTPTATSEPATTGTSIDKAPVTKSTQATNIIPSISGTSGTNATPSTSGTSGTNAVPSTSGTSGTNATPSTSGTSGTNATPSTSGTSGTNTTPSTSGASGTNATPPTSSTSGTNATHS